MTEPGSQAGEAMGRHGQEGCRQRGRNNQVMGKSLRPSVPAEAGSPGRQCHVLGSIQSEVKRCGFCSPLPHFTLGQVIGPGCTSRAMPGYDRHWMHFVDCICTRQPDESVFSNGSFNDPLCGEGSRKTNQFE